VWTNVAEVHREFFDSIEAIADAKAEILERATPTTVLVANADDRLVMARSGGFVGRTITFSAADAPGASVMATAIQDLGLDGMRAEVRTAAGRTAWRLPLLGRGNLMNSLAALAIGLEFEVPLAEMADRAETLAPAAHRGEVTRLAGGVTVVDDAYNSNPHALRVALSVLAAEQRCTRRVAVLGEMLELGAESRALHEACGRAAASSGLSALVAVGGDAAAALARAAVAAGMAESAVRYVLTSEEAADIATGIVKPGDVVLVKGSRGIRTERVVERLEAAFG
jgi:UDP-N-acetylmuramoyl-tripeptide--D-alanyl-D-alanine ligase